MLSEQHMQVLKAIQSGCGNRRELMAALGLGAQQVEILLDPLRQVGYVLGVTTMNQDPLKRDNLCLSLDGERYLAE